jgi:Tol biopolymer transport system component
VCTASLGCGSVAARAPLSAYEAAAIAPDAAHVAVVVDDVVTGSSQLQVLDTVRGTVLARIAGGVRPSWSADGSELALVTGSTVEVMSLASDAVTVVATGVGLTGPPLWTGPSTLVLSTTSSAAGPAGIELVNLAAGARYTLPAATPGSIAVAVSPGGSRLAVADPTGRVLVVPAAGAAGPGQLLAGHLDAIGFTDEGTLVAINRDSDALVRVSVGGGDTSGITLSAGFADLATVRVTPDGRRLVYLAVDGTGVAQAYVANADGSGATPCTGFVTGSGLEAGTVGFSS